MKPRISRKYDDMRLGATILSLALPGLGHWALGQKAWAVFFGVTAILTWLIPPAGFSWQVVVAHLACAVNCSLCLPRLPRGAGV